LLQSYFNDSHFSIWFHIGQKDMWKEI
jgi:hypothetical protein